MSNGVTITLVLNLKPDVVDAFCGDLPDRLKDTKKFAGFRNIRIVRHKTDRSQVIFIEEWDSEDAYNKYLAWRTERGDVDAMAGLIAAPPKMDIWPTLVAV